jgi:hypothetical protein
MSTNTYIADLEAAGALKRYEPKGRHFPKRRLYLSTGAVRDLEEPGSAVNALGSRGFVESAFTRWTNGELVYADARGKPSFLKRLDPPPPEIWEIRITEPVVQVRALGRFPEPDTLVLTRICTRGVLGDKGSLEWKHTLETCEDLWSALGLPIFAAGNIHQYVTENCDDFRI